MMFSDEDGQTLDLETPEGAVRRFVLRPLEKDDFEACVAFQKEIWGTEFRELVPPAVLMITRRVGGLIAGAFDMTGELVGMIYGLTGPCDGELLHWSHMMAVRREARGLGLGRHLKLYQRRRLLEIGVERAEWTFDPLEARNGHLNLEGLGAKAVEYLRDVYGDGSTSELHRGIGTDRLRVEWHLHSPEVKAAIHRTSLPTPTPWRSAIVVNIDETGEPRIVPWELPDRIVVRIEVPQNIQALKEEDPDAARRWREATRWAFVGYLEQSYEIVRFHRDEKTHRCYYVLLAEP